MKLLALLTLFFLLACNPQQNTTVAIQSKIIGGNPVNFAQWNNVVKIDMGSLGGSCTGTVISKRVILTAGHCVKGTAASSFRITVKDPKNLFKNKTYRASNARYHALYNNNASIQNFDVAYLYLKEDFIIAEDNFIPLISWEELQEVAIGDELTMVGYGRTDNGSSGTKMVVNIPLTMLTNSEVLAGTATKNTCQGDSGGPSFITLPNGEVRQIGVTSRGEKGCRGRGIYELTASVGAWIEADILFLEGKILYHEGKYQEAQDKLIESLQLFPLYVDTYNYIAATAKKMGDEENQMLYLERGNEIKILLEKRITNYYLAIFNFENKIPTNYLNYGCNVRVDSTPFENKNEFFYLLFDCDEQIKVKVSFNNLYQDIKDENIDYIYIYESIRHKMTIHFPEESIPESAENVILKLFRCSKLESCSNSFAGELSFSGYSKQFRLFDTTGFNRDQINLRWNHEL